MNTYAAAIKRRESHRAPSLVRSFRVSDLALTFYIFATVVFSEGAIASIASKVLLVTVVLFELISRSRISSRKLFSGFITSALLFFLWNASSILWSVLPSESIARVKTLLYQFICYACVSFLVIDDRQAMKVCLVSFVLSACVSAVLVIIIHGVTFQDNRTSEGIISPGQLGITSMFSMFVCLYWWRKTKQRRYLLLFGLLAIAMLLTSARRPFFSLLVFMTLFLTLRSKDIRKRMIAFVGVVLLVLTINILCLKVDVLYQYIGHRLESFLDYVVSGIGADASTQGRARLVDYGMTLFQASPIIGNGSGTFETLFSMTQGSWLTSADNNYVELLADTGIIGFLLYYIPLTVFIIHNSKEVTKASLETQFALCGVLAMAAIDFATVWFFSKCGMLIMLLLYLMAKDGQVEQELIER